MDYHFLNKVVRAQDFDSFPLDWSALFGKDQPLIVEIGFGSGEYMEQLCDLHRDHHFVGFETSALSVVKTLRRLHRKGIHDVRVLMTDARFGLENLFPEESVSKVILNFPCPWSKQRHLHRRVIVPSFFSTLNGVLKMGGEMELATDVLSYAQDTQRIAEEWGFDVAEIARNPIREIQTRYEKKWLRYDRDIYCLQIKKRIHRPLDRKLSKEEPMPHAFVPVSLMKTDRLSQVLEKSHFDEKTQSTCVFKEVFRDLEQPHYLVKTIAFDGDFQQHFMIVIYARQDDWVIKLDSATNPFRTPAVKFAIHQLKEVLIEQ